MRFSVSLFETFDRNVGVNLRGRKTGVAEQRLDAAEIGAAIEHVGGEAVAQFVGTDGDRNSRCVANSVSRPAKSSGRRFGGALY